MCASASVCVCIGEHVYWQIYRYADYAKPASICMHTRACMCVCVSALAFCFVVSALPFYFSIYLRILFSKIYNDCATSAIIEIKQLQQKRTTIKFNLCISVCVYALFQLVARSLKQQQQQQQASAAN